MNPFLYTGVFLKTIIDEILPKKEIKNVKIK
jgi:hypothetical protein